MSNRTKITIDGKEAVAYISYKLNEVMAIYPITPSSNMGEWCDQWASEGKRNVWGTIPSVVEMQSEGGAAGAIHGASKPAPSPIPTPRLRGCCSRSRICSKSPAKLIPTVFHISARTLATSRPLDFRRPQRRDVRPVNRIAMLSSASVQEAMDFACIANAANLQSPGAVPPLF